VDLKKYIESGILEQYVLGLLSVEDRMAVEQNIAKYPEIKTELDQIEQTFESYISLHQRPAPQGLEGRILEKIKNIDPDPPGSTGPSAQPNAPKSGPPKWSLFLLATVAAIGLLFAGYSNAQNQKKAAQVSSLEQELAVLKTDCDEKDQTINTLQEQLQIIRTANNSLIQMNGTPKAPGAIASIYWNENTRKTYLDIVNLPPPPTDKQYQLWAIVDGTPVDMGVFDVVLDGSTLQEVPFIENPQAFAVTLENKGGSPTPTLEEMVVIGNV